MSFKVGDRVKIIAKDDKYFGEVGTIKPPRSRGFFDWYVAIPSKESGWPCKEEELEKVSKSRPKKEKPVKYIAFYDENDVDPAKKFTSRKDLVAWIKEAKENENIVFDSIEVYLVGKRLKVEFKTSVFLK